MIKRLGLVQTRGIGDIIIALPIADYYIEQGWEVCWPIDAGFVEMFRRIKPSINFIPVERREPTDFDYFINDPVRFLQQEKCTRIVVLYNSIGNLNIPDSRLVNSFKFDEYKYIVAGVPFERKWQLKFERDLKREEELFERLNISGDYVLIHDKGSNMDGPIEIPDDLLGGLPVVRIAPLTDSIFDWLLTIERARKLLLVDSCYANLVEQLNLENEKAVFLRSPIRFTPVFANGWRFLFPKKTAVE